MGGRRINDPEPVTPSFSEAYALETFTDTTLNETVVGGLSPGERTYHVWTVSFFFLVFIRKRERVCADSFGF